MSKYKLKYVDKRLNNKKSFKRDVVTLVSLTTLMSASIIGCGLVKSRIEENNYQLEKHKKNHDLSYEEMTNCELLEIQIGYLTDLYMCKKTKKVDKGTVIYSYDTIDNNTNMYNETAIGNKKYDVLDVATLIKRSDNIEDYLVNFNKVQEWYTPEEQKEILNDIKSVYEFSFYENKDKQKVLN